MNFLYQVFFYIYAQLRSFFVQFSQNKEQGPISTWQEVGVVVVDFYHKVGGAAMFLAQGEPDMVRHRRAFNDEGKYKYLATPN